MTAQRKRTRVLRLAGALAMAIVFGAQQARAAPGGVKISQVYSGGGTSTGVYRNDYVELFNSGPAPVDLTGWSLQYGSQTGNFGTTSSAVYAFPEGISLAPGAYLLVQLGPAGSGGLTLTEVISPDLATSGLNMAATNGKVALAAISTTLGCGGAAEPCVLPDPRIADLVAWGGVTATAEGTAVNYPSALDSSRGAVRRLSGCQDLDDNRLDFTLAITEALAPRNSASPARACGVELVKSAPSVVPAGAVYTYTLVATNAGPALGGAVITDRLPPALAYLPGSATDGGLAAGSLVSWPAADLAHAAVVTRAFAVTAPSAPGPVVNADYGIAGAGSVWIPGVPVTTAVGSLHLTKTGPPAGQVDQNVTFSLAYANAGEILLRGVTLTDTLPSGLAYVSDTRGGGRVSGAHVVWDLGDLAAGASGAFDVLARPTAAGAHVNRAAIAGIEDGGGVLAGAAEWTVTVAGAPPAEFIATTTVLFTPMPIVLAGIEVTAVPTSVVANGTSTSAIVALARDAQGRPMADVPVALAATRGTLSPASGQTDASGRFTATLTSGLDAGLAEVTASSGAFTATAGVTFTPEPIVLGHIAVTAAPTSVVADGASASVITVLARDTRDRPMADAPVTLEATRGTLSAASGQTDASGRFTATLTAGLDAGLAEVTARSGAFNATAAVTFTPEPIELAGIAVTAVPTSVVADGASASVITVRAWDTRDRPMADVPVTLETTRGTLSATSGRTGADGRFTAMLVAGYEAGVAEVTARAGEYTVMPEVAFTAAPAALEGSYAASAPYAATGSVVTFTLNVTNAGLGGLPGVHMTATVPPGTTLIGSSGGALSRSAPGAELGVASGAGADAGGDTVEVAWSGPLAPGESHALQLAVRVEAASGEIASQARYSAPGVEVRAIQRSVSVLPTWMKFIPIVRR
jgi:uncharacterized repeat protein (TIGR01451 family)